MTEKELAALAEATAKKEWRDYAFQDCSDLAKSLYEFGRPFVNALHDREIEQKTERDTAKIKFRQAIYDIRDELQIVIDGLQRRVNALRRLVGEAVAEADEPDAAC